MKDYCPSGENEFNLRFCTIFLIGCWTMVVIFSIIWRINQESEEKIFLAKEIARSHLEKDLILRDWNISHGLVYGPVTDKHPPNPLLNIPEREVVTPSGKILTAINSSAMIRQIYELAGKNLAYSGRLTSLTPLNPENAPDPWEQRALTKLDGGAQEVSDAVSKDEQLSFRLIQPLIATERCLGCHSQYTPGKVAGGISISLPMATIVSAWDKTRWFVVFAHGYLWLAGLLCLIFGANQLQKKIKAKHEVEIALRQSERNYRLLAKTIPALVYRGYADGRVDFVDEKVEVLTGYSREQFFTGRVKWPDIIFEQDKEGCKKIFLQALKGDGSYRREYRIRRQNGEITWVAERSQIVCDGKGKIEFISGVIFDISLQKEMEKSLKESERFWKTILEAVGVGLMVINRINECITEVNPQAVALIGCKREDMLGKNSQQFFSCSLKEQLSFNTTIGGENRSEGTLIKADGTNIPIWKTAALIKFEGVDYALVSFVDLSDQRQAESALIQANKDLQIAMAEVRQANKEMGLMSNLAELLQICQSPDESYPIIERYAKELFPEISGALYVLNSSNNLLTIVAEWGQTLAGNQIFSPDDCWALRQGKSYSYGSTPNAALNPYCHHLAADTVGSHLCTPLMGHGETIGLLYLEKLPNSEGLDTSGKANVGLSESQQKLAKTLAEHISLSLANLKLRQILRLQAIRDALTGLFNRRYLQETLEREIHRAKRKQSSLGIVMLDVDHFKHFNDTYGHGAGDKLLAVLGRYLKDAIRMEDIACRYGGEEFTLILLDVVPEVLLKRAETIREGAKNLEVFYQGKLLPGVTISLGLSYFPHHGSDCETLLQTADAALYQAKKTGRDQVIMSNCQPSNITGESNSETEGLRSIGG